MCGGVKTFVGGGGGGFQVTALNWNIKTYFSESKGWCKKDEIGWKYAKFGLLGIQPEDSTLIG